MKENEQEITIRQLKEELEEARARIAALEQRDAGYRAERKQIEDECEWLMTEVESQRRRVGELIRALELERDTLHTIMENTRTCLAYLDPEFIFVTVNTAYVASTGRRAGELIGHNYFEVFPGSENEALFVQVRDSGKPIAFHARPFRNPGQPERSVAYWDWSLVPVKDAMGQVQGLVFSLLDVTEREHLLEQLAAERARLKAIIENAPEGIVVADADLRIIMANPAADRLYGRRVPYGEEFAGNQSQMLTYPDGTPYDPHDLPLTRAAQGGEVQTDLEVGIRWPNGQQRALLINAAPIRDRRGQIGGAMAVFQDITQRKAMEEALRRRNRDLDLLNRVSQALTAVLDLPQVITQLLEGITEIASAEGSSVWLWKDETRQQLICHAMYLNGQTLPPVGFELCPGRGLVGWVAQQGESAIVADVAQDPRFMGDIDARTGFHTVSLLAVPMRVRDSVIGVLEAVNKRDGEFDRSDLALAETLGGAAAIAIENARLVEALRERTDELRARNEELDAFAHTVAHDLQQPLAAILGFAEVLADEELDLPMGEMRRHLAKVWRIGNKMGNIIDTLLLMAEVRERDVEREPVDMAAVAEEALQRMAPMIAETSAEVIVPDRPAWPVAMGNAPWLEEVWCNYLSNALKYGGRPPRVELGGAAQPDGTARFWVRDYGPGLTAEEQARLFAAYTRLQSGQITGHGLGLSIVRRIVEKLGGQVGVESDGVPGRGCVFSFTLPAADAGKERRE